MSCSWPTAETIGTREPATARTTASSLNGNRSWKLPPPRVEHDDVDVRMCGQRGESRHDRLRRSLPLDPRLADHDSGGRETRRDRRHEIPAGGGVRPREDPDRAWDARQTLLPLRCEEALGGELPLQLLERDEVTSDTEPLDRRRPEGEHRLLLEELCATRDVDGLPLVEVELETLVGATRDRDGQRRSRPRVLQREEDVGPRRIAAELGDLALDPEVRKPSEVNPDAAVERRHGEHLAFAVEEVLDLRHRAQRIGEG